MSRGAPRRRDVPPLEHAGGWEETLSGRIVQRNPPAFLCKSSPNQPREGLRDAEREADVAGLERRAQSPCPTPLTVAVRVAAVGWRRRGAAGTACSPSPPRPPRSAGQQRYSQPVGQRGAGVPRYRRSSGLPRRHIWMQLAFDIPQPFRETEEILAERRGARRPARRALFTPRANSFGAYGEGRVCRRGARRAAGLPPRAPRPTGAWWKERSHQGPQLGPLQGPDT